MKNPHAALFMLILALSLTSAQFSGVQDYQTEGICPQCWQSSIALDASKYPLINVHATYINATTISPTGQTGTKISNDQLHLEVLPAKRAHINFYINGFEALNAAGEPCEAITDEEGNAQCAISHIQPPGTSAPIAIDELKTNALLTARLSYSDENSKIKPSSTPPVLIRTQNSKPVFYTILSAQMQEPRNIFLCLPAMIVFGLLIASMQYMGKNPLSLFDLTVPKMPNLKRVRMRPASIPYHLAIKGRFSARIIGRTERSTKSQILTLYKRSGKNYSAIAREIDKLFPYRTLKAAPEPFANETSPGKLGYRDALERLRTLIEQSGASNSARARAWGVVQRNLQVREALALDLKTTTAARTGQFANRRGKIGSALEFTGKRLAKPWKLIFGDNKYTDRLPGIPFIERTFLVIDNWVGSRYGNIMVRRSLYKSLAAESMRSLGIARDSDFVKKNIYDSKKVGEIPRIIEKMRQETYILGRAIVDEYMRSLTLAISLARKKVRNSEEEFTLNKNGLKDVLAIMERVKKEVDEKIRRGEYPSQYRNYFENESIMESLRKYIIDNKIQMHDALGNKLSPTELKEFLNKAVEYARQVRELVMQDRISTSDGMYPSFSDEKSKLINPDDVYGRYKKVVDMLDYSKKQLAQGRIPMVMLGHDIAEIFGIAVGAKIAREEIVLTSEAQRLSHIRRMMETELMQKCLFDYIIARNALDDQGKTLKPMEGGTLNRNWIRKLEEKVSIDEIRKMMDYSKRGEWASRNFMTAYYSTQNEFSHDNESNKINALRQVFSAQFDRGHVTLFRNSQNKIARNFMVYEGMKTLVEFYTGNKWDAQGYEDWKQKGARYEYIRKGIWVIDANHVITPIASDYKFDERGRAISANHASEDGRLTYKFSALAGFMGSEYAERPINTSYLFKDHQGRWRPGTPTDRETSNMISQLKEYHRQFTDPKYAAQTDARMKSLSQKEIISQLTENKDIQVRETMQNMDVLRANLDGRMRIVTRESLGYDKSMPASIRLRTQLKGFVERATRGGVHDIDMRTQEWYASQAYARITLESYQEDFKKRILISDETKSSLDAKDQLASSRSELNKLMTTARLTSEQKERVRELREIYIPSQIRNVHYQENRAIRTQREMHWPDRDVKRIADSFTPFYNIAEQTVMRDPRITFGSAYGLSPALMSGYQTGQFGGEHPQMWAGMSLMPGDRMLNFLSRPSYFASMAFGTHTRTFFTRMTGYSTIYHLDPERGLRQDSVSPHEQNLWESVQSVFKPFQSFDWFTRTVFKPNIRPLSSYRDEFGITLKEETSVVGRRSVMPISFKSGGSDRSFDIDSNRAKLMGIDIMDEMRRNKIGLTFREEFQLWNKRYAAYEKDESTQIIRNLKAYLNTSTDRAERSMIKSQIKEMQDVFKTREGLNRPILRDIFKQGYYAVENRSGYDIVTIGGAHRPSEMVWAFHDTLNTAPIPGMMFTDFKDRFQMFPFVTMTLANPLKGGPLEKMVSRIAPERPELSGEENLTRAGVGRPIQAEALRDVYRRETPIFLEFLKIEQERQMFQYHNSPYVFPIAPAYVLGYNLFIKKNVPRLSNAAWSSETPKNDYEFFTNPARLKADQLMQVDRLKQRKQDAQERQKQQDALEKQTKAKRHEIITYTCPTHGISLPSNTMCPLCKTQEQVELERSQSRLMLRLNKTKYTIKNWAISAVSLGGSIPVGNYNHYFNVTTCNNHGIQHSRGTPCPMCLTDKVRSGELSQINARVYNERIKSINKEIDHIYTSLKSSEEMRTKLVDEKIAEKRNIAQEFNVLLNLDKRDMPYKHSRIYIQSELKKTSDDDRKYGYKLKFL